MPAQARQVAAVTAKKQADEERKSVSMRGRWASVISEARKAAALQQQPGQAQQAQQQAQQQGQQAQQAPHAQQARSTSRGLTRIELSVVAWGKK